MGKKDKEHRKKVAIRNIKIKQEQDRFKKMQKEMLLKLIEEEKKKGMFDNVPQVSPINDMGISGPII